MLCSFFLHTLALSFPVVPFQMLLFFFFSFFFLMQLLLLLLLLLSKNINFPTFYRYSFTLFRAISRFSTNFLPLCFSFYSLQFMFARVEWMMHLFLLCFCKNVYHTKIEEMWAEWILPALKTFHTTSSFSWSFYYYIIIIMMIIYDYTLTTINGQTT